MQLMGVGSSVSGRYDTRPEMERTAGEAESSLLSASTLESLDSRSPAAALREGMYASNAPRRDNSPVARRMLLFVRVTLMRLGDTTSTRKTMSVRVSALLARSHTRRVRLSSSIGVLSTWDAPRAMTAASNNSDTAPASFDSASTTDGEYMIECSVRQHVTYSWPRASFAKLVGSLTSSPASRSSCSAWNESRWRRSVFSTPRSTNCGGRSSNAAKWNGACGRVTKLLASTHGKPSSPAPDRSTCSVLRARWRDTTTASYSSTVWRTTLPTQTVPTNPPHTARPPSTSHSRCHCSMSEQYVTRAASSA